MDVDEPQSPGVSVPTESPHVRVRGWRLPQEPHVRNGITRHKTARLLTWPCQSWNVFMQAGQGDAADSPGRSRPDRPSVNRQVMAPSSLADASIEP